MAPNAADAARAGPEAQAAFTVSFEAFASEVAAHLPENKDRRRQALTLAATAVGALTLARAGADETAAELLEAARASVFNVIDREDGDN
ncbi:MAG: hypothetical protein AAF360_05070 [Pseudomonadota bacterium]